MLSGESYAGNLTSKTVDSTTTSYTYDAIDQLLTEKIMSGLITTWGITYTYDGNGNRASKQYWNQSHADLYNCDAGDKLTSITNNGSTVKSFGYDSAGRRTSQVDGSGTTSYAYDYEGWLTGITYPSTATNSFAYNGLDARVSKTDSAGTATFSRDGVDPTDSVLNDSSAEYTPGISERRSSTSKFYGADRMGTNSLEENSSQSVTATKQYDAFGMLKSSTGTSASPFGYAGAWGYQEDGDSSLKLLGHRYYDPSTGRFLTRDPAEFGRNWFSYCGNNPPRRTDPTGYFYIAGFEFTWQGTWEGIKTGVAGLLHGASLGYYDGGGYQDEPGFGFATGCGYVLYGCAATAGIDGVVPGGLGSLLGIGGSAGAATVGTAVVQELDDSGITIAGMPISPTYLKFGTEAFHDGPEWIAGTVLREGVATKFTSTYIQLEMDGTANGTGGNWELGIDTSGDSPLVSHWFFRPFQD